MVVAGLQSVRIRMKKIDKEETRNLLRDYIRKCEENFLIAETILNVADKFVGKKITKHFFTAVEKELAKTSLKYDHSYWDTNYGMYHINIRPLGRKHDDQFRGLIGYSHKGYSKEEDIFPEKKKLEEYLTCYLLENERALSASKLLLNLNDFIIEQHKLVDELEALDKRRKELFEKFTFGEIPWTVERLMEGKND